MSISKGKQDFVLSAKFDPQLVKLRRTKPFKETDHFERDIEFVIQNSTMGFGERVRCEFVPIKSFKEAQKRIQNLRNFAKKLAKNKCFEPVSVVIVDGNDLYFGSVMAPDYNKGK